ncbi:MAG: hypothetical protein V4548_00365 [Bacteroidota bacterium]
MNLQEKYTELLLRIGFTEEQTNSNWAAMEKAYSSKSRSYHNLNHIKEMVALYDIYKSNLSHPNEVLYAIFYHDYIYKSTQKDNEIKSADLAIKLLSESTNLNKTIVYDCICVTKDHQFRNSEDEKWMIDFDLKILAKGWEDYKIYYEQIRKEYKIYPDFLYNPGRKKALEHFLEKKYIFQTETFRAEFDSQARKNIQQEIDFLTI